MSEDAEPHDASDASLAPILCAALDMLDCGIAVIAATGNVVLVNDAWRRLAESGTPCAARGAPGSSYLQRDVHTAMCIEARAAAEGVRAVVAQEQAGFSVEYPCQEPAQKRWFRMNATSCEISGAHHVVIVHRAITCAKLTQETLRAEVQRLAQIVEALPHLIAVVRADGRIEYRNLAWGRLFGAGEGDLAEEVVPSKLHPDDRARWLSTWREALRGEVPYRLEQRARAAPDGGYSWYCERGSKMRGAEGEADRWLVHMFCDDERRQKEAELQALLHRKDAFLATLLHELRNPLAPIANALELLGRHPHEASIVTRAQEIIQRQVRQLTRLVDDLLDVSRIGRGSVDVQRTRLDVTEVIATAVEAARPLIDLRGHHLATSLPPERCLVDGDLARLAQVITNLLINAAKYTDPGGYITVSAWLATTHVEIRVRDSGIGIAREQLQHVFELFAQAPGTAAGRMGGLGIGLAVARQLIELHGGTIRAQSEGPGRGSEFIVCLPRVEV